MPVVWGLAKANLGEREVAQALLEHDRPLIEDGQVIVADKGFAGKDFEDFTAGLGAILLRPNRKDEPARFGNLGKIRQWVESVFGTLKDQFTLEPGKLSICPLVQAALDGRHLPRIVRDQIVFISQSRS